MVNIELDDDDEEETEFYDVPDDLATPSDLTPPSDPEHAEPRITSCDSEPKGEPSSQEGGGDVAPTAPEKSDEERIAEAEEVKAEGNAFYKAGDIYLAVEKYSEALVTAPELATQRAIYYANRAACYLQLKQYQQVVDDCTSSLKVKGKYIKALQRRAQAYEHLDDLDKALEDYRSIHAEEASDIEVKQNIRRLEPIVKERHEKMKEEMIGKLKDLGNSVLGHFGLSCDNFKATKDPNTGAYSINFQQ